MLDFPCYKRAEMNVFEGEKISVNDYRGAEHTHVHIWHHSTNVEAAATAVEARGARLGRAFAS